MKTDLFQSCGHCWIFQICWYIECSTFTASSFRIWNSSTGIPSPPLALFVVMLLKAHLTSHSRMSYSNQYNLTKWWDVPTMVLHYVWLCLDSRPVLFSFAGFEEASFHGVRPSLQRGPVARNCRWPQGAEGDLVVWLLGVPKWILPTTRVNSKSVSLAVNDLVFIKARETKWNNPYFEKNVLR